ncbi:MAG: sigma-70 family RNA polymerase sigma factor [Thermodesulfovibrionales bacterium]|jgi:RNA polymerase sigma-70 factor (ECF subfamily)|nr:sigma-70 family RNA polymerase sigma factor [Thermodesulfovibrionales bacterium]
MNDDMRSEEYSIIKQCMDGNAEIYAVLVERYKNMVYNIAYRMLGDDEAANDMAQESFISAYVALKDFKKGAKFSSWLCSIAINKCRDYLRSKKDNISIDEIAEVSTSKIATPENVLYEKQAEQNIQAALSALPGDYREAIVLKHIEGLDYREMENILGVSENVLKVRAHRGREMLKRLLKERGIINE